MAGVVAEVAVPTAAGPRLDLHRKGSAIRGFVVWTELVEDGFEDDVDGGCDQFILHYLEGLGCLVCAACCHHYFSFGLICCVMALRSARSLMRLGCVATRGAHPRTVGVLTSGAWAPGDRDEA